VGNPDFFKQVNEQLNAVPLEDWKVYLRWKTLNAYAPVLTKAFVEEDFLFNGKYLSGQREMEPRWKRCVKSTDATWAWRSGSFM
jgi:putative endopeptidase